VTAGPERLIGLTGGVASGKSTVAAMLRELGAAIVDADLLARRVVEPGQPALGEIVETFGRSVLGPGGRLDRRRLARLIFGDPADRARLNAITHPRIAALGQEEIDRARARGERLIVFDLPLLFENHREGGFDGVLLVYADPQTQVSRLRARSALGEEEARARLAAQWPIDRKRELATWVIDNSDGLAATRDQVQRIWAAWQAR